MCGCRQSTQAHASPGTGGSSPATAPAPLASVPLAYRGTRALLIRGPATGAGYACYPGETLRVHAPDVPHLLASGVFTRVPLSA